MFTFALWAAGLTHTIIAAGGFFHARTTRQASDFAVVGFLALTALLLVAAAVAM